MTPTTVNEVLSMSREGAEPGTMRLLRSALVSPDFIVLVHNGPSASLSTIDISKDGNSHSFKFGDATLNFLDDPISEFLNFATR